MTNNIIAHNTGSIPQVSIGENTTPTLMNNTIVGNGLSNGIMVEQGSAPTLVNNVVVDNVVGVWGDGTSVPILANNLVWDNSQADYSNIDPGTSDVSCDPDFVDAADDDYHLGICSCAVDAGTNVDAPADDYDGNTRPVDGDGDGTATVDIGAYERLTVTAPLPMAGFTHVTDGLVVTFTNTSSSAVSYQWDFGDGVGTSTAVNPTYTYAMPGTYTVTLTATCSFGCSDTYQDIVEVKQYCIYLPLVMRTYP